jgi:hypothetical protein
MAQAQNQPTPEQLKAMQSAKNAQALSLAVENTLPMNQQNGNTYGLGKNLQFDSPVLGNAHAKRITVRHNLVINWNGVGTVTPTASYPYSFVNNVTINYGGKQASFHPIISKFEDQLDGYNNQVSDDVVGFRLASVDNMLRKVPSTLASGDNIIRFDSSWSLNSLHDGSANGLLPLYSTGTRMQVMLNLPSIVAQAKADALDMVFETSGGAVITVSGTIDVLVDYIDTTSFSTRSPLEVDLTGLSTVQVIELPQAVGLSPQVYNYVSFRNPYATCKIYHILCDGMSATQFADPSNILGYRMDKAENTANPFFVHDETTGSPNAVNYYKNFRRKFGKDLDAGVFVFDGSTYGVEAIASKTGGAYLNLTGQGFPAARFGFKLNQVGTDRVSKIKSYAVILNDEGIQTR